MLTMCLVPLLPAMSSVNASTMVGLKSLSMCPVADRPRARPVCFPVRGVTLHFNAPCGGYCTRCFVSTSHSQVSGLPQSAFPLASYPFVTHVQNRSIGYVQLLQQVDRISSLSVPCREPHTRMRISASPALRT